LPIVKGNNRKRFGALATARCLFHEGDMGSRVAAAHQCPPSGTLRSDGLHQDDMEHSNLSAVLVSVTPDGMAAKIAPIDGSHDLFDVEDRAIHNAAPRRRDEFAAGRAAARGALATLAIAPVPIPRAPDRRPLWPNGIIGSISHTDGIAAAIVGHDQTTASVGLDIEGDAPLKKELRKYILTRSEAAARKARPLVANSSRCKATFAAKEALFKAIYPITGQFFGFLDANVDLHESGNWTATLCNTAPALPASMVISGGKWAAVDGFVIATIHILKAP